MSYFIFLYNILILIFCLVPLAFSTLFYRSSKENLYLFVSLIFFARMFDTLILYMTMIVPAFNRFYNSSFFSVSSVKTIIVAITLGSLLGIHEHIMNDKKPLPVYRFLLVTAILLMLLLPMFPHHAAIVWSYYQLAQIFLIILGFDAQHRSRAVPFAEQSRLFASYCNFMAVLIFLAIFIMAEDTVVIFLFDSYGRNFHTVKRNISEDITTVVAAIYAIRILILSFKNHFIISEAVAGPAAKGDLKPDLGPAAGLTAEPAVFGQEPAAAASQELSKFYLFCKDYQLTTREQDIFSLMLESKTNQEISDELMISLGTAKTHTHNIFQKLEISRRRELLELYRNYMPEKTKDQ